MTITQISGLDCAQRATRWSGRGRRTGGNRPSDRDGHEMVDVERSFDYRLGATICPVARLLLSDAVRKNAFSRCTGALELACGALDAKR
jgi:hypothetical protein